MTALSNQKHVPWYLWPIYLPLKIAFFIISLAGRFVGLILAAIFILLGKLLCATIIGAIVGLPLLLIGIALGFNCLFKW
jgi:hypothetical protein